MKLKVYKADYDYSMDNIRNELSEKGYERVASINRDRSTDVYFELYFDVHDKTLPIWYGEISDFFQIETEELFPKQFNAVIIAKTNNSIYLVPKGQGYHLAFKVADLNFGLDFAERQIHSKEVTLKSSNYIQNNKVSEVTNYRNSGSELPRANESIFTITAKPKNEEIYGETIECSSGITLSKNYNLWRNSENNNITSFTNLFNEIDTTMSQDKLNNLPRSITYSKNSEESRQLDNHLYLYLQDETNDNISFNVNKILEINNGITINDEINNLFLYVKNNRDTTKQIGINSVEVMEFLESNSNLISSLNDIKYKLYDEDDNVLSRGEIKDILFAEIENDENTYLLQNGRWQYLNNSFIKALNNQLAEYQKYVYFDSDYNSKYQNDENESNFNEDSYIEELSDNLNVTVLHKKFVKDGSTQIEIADLYDQSKNELFAIKMGTETSKALYSLDQANLGTKILINSKEFNVKDDLQNIDETLESTIIEDIISCKNINILWLVRRTPNYIYEDVINERFRLEKFKSLLLKLKLSDWITSALEHNFNPKIYFSYNLYD